MVRCVDIWGSRELWLNEDTEIKDRKINLLNMRWIGVKRNRSSRGAFVGFGY